MQAFNINKAEAQKILEIKSEAEYRIWFYIGDNAMEGWFQSKNRTKL